MSKQYPLTVLLESPTLWLGLNFAGRGDVVCHIHAQSGLASYGVVELGMLRHTICIDHSIISYYESPLLGQRSALV